MKSESNDPKAEPNAEQWQAVKAFAAKHGRNWKAALRAEWMDACQGITDPDQQALLQQVRNQLGPRWLASVRLKEEGR